MEIQARAAGSFLQLLRSRGEQPERVDRGKKPLQALRPRDVRYYGSTVISPLCRVDDRIRLTIRFAAQSPLERGDAVIRMAIFRSVVDGDVGGFYDDPDRTE